MTTTRPLPPQYAYPNRWTAAARYASTLPTRPESRYAAAYINWMRGGAVALPPDHPRLSRARAGAIRDAIHGFKLWGD